MAEQEAQIIAAGNWCAPSEFALDLVSVNRGGITYRTPYDLSPEALAAQETLQAAVRRATEEHLRRRDEAIERAVRVASLMGWDVHLHEHPDLHWRDARDADAVALVYRLGVEFAPAEHGLPTIHWHRHDATWDWDDD